MQHKNITLLTVLFLSGCVPMSAMNKKWKDPLKTPATIAIFCKETNDSFKRNKKEEKANEYRLDSYKQTVASVKRAKTQFTVIKTDYLNQPVRIVNKKTVYNSLVNNSTTPLTLKRTITRTLNRFYIEKELFDDQDKEIETIYDPCKFIQVPYYWLSCNKMGLSLPDKLNNNSHYRVFKHDVFNDRENTDKEKQKAKKEFVVCDRIFFCLNRGKIRD